MNDKTKIFPEYIILYTIIGRGIDMVETSV